MRQIHTGERRENISILMDAGGRGTALLKEEQILFHILFKKVFSREGEFHQTAKQLKCLSLSDLDQ